MEIFFQDPTDIPLPPKEIRIRKLIAEPLSGGRQVRVSLELTPFQKRPNGDISIYDTQSEEVARISFIETIDPKMQFTMHLRTPEIPGEYTVTATVFYPDPLSDTVPDEDLKFDEIPTLLQQEKMVVDKSTTTFSFLNTSRAVIATILPKGLPPYVDPC